MSKLTTLKFALVAFVAMLAAAHADDMVMDKMEDSTVSPIADMAIIDEEMKTSTERPPVMELTKQDEKPTSQRHTVADFIIHPLIAFKPRNPEDDNAAAAAGKQANNANGASSTTTPSPWQIFGFNAGQGLGSQVTNLAGQVTGWLNDRIQFPGLVETPVRESTSTSTTTTTTPRPDVVVRVQHKASTRRPIISINNRNRPNRAQFESQENNDDDEDEEDNEENEEGNEEDNDEGNQEGNDEGNNSDEATEDNESSNEAQENNSDEEEEDDEPKKDEDQHTDDEEEENHSQRPNHKRRPLRNHNNNKNKNVQRKRVQPQQQSNNRRRFPSKRRNQAQPQRRRPAAGNEINDEEVQDDDEYVNDDANDIFFHGARPSTRRSQSSPNFIQRGQQHLINQIRQLTRGQTPAEIGAAIRKPQRGNTSNNKRRQQATLFVNRNGQTIYVAPELTQLTAPQFQQIYAQPIVQKPVTNNAFPQPPLTVPLKRRGQPTQYITIPWSQLGISPPSNIVSITEGIQSQPLILNIPQSAIHTMQSQAVNRRKKKRPQLITANAVPLLAEASLMDIFKPPQIPPSRTTASNKPVTVANATPVIVASKPTSTKTSSTLFQQRIIPGTIIEKAPEVDAMKTASESETKIEEISKIDSLRATGEKEFILVGDDNEPGVMRKVEPALGDARYVRLTGNSQYYDVLPRRRFTVRRGGRELNQAAEMPQITEGDKTEQLIPVQIVNEAEVPASIGESAQIALSESVKSESSTTIGDAVFSDPIPAASPVLVSEITQQSTNAMTT